MEIIKYLGNKLAEFIHISPPSARGLIKLAIIDQFGPFKPLNEIIFRELREVLENALKKRLLSFNIANIDNIIPELTDLLLKYQSLIVMEKI